MATGGFTTIARLLITLRGQNPPLCQQVDGKSVEGSKDVRHRDTRISVRIDARMRVGDRWSDVAICNVSTRGMLLAADDPPKPGSYIEIRRATVMIVARSVWSDEGQFGVRAQDHIDLEQLVAARRDGVPAANTSADGQYNDRRSRARVADRGARSMDWSRRIQFVAVLSVVSAAAIYGAIGVSEILGTPIAAIERALAGG